MSGLVRIVLVIVNAVFLAWLAYWASTETYVATPDEPEFWLSWGMLAFLGLNFLYLITHDQFRIGFPSNRISRLIGLWFDAKESELRKRANRSQQGE